MRIFYAVNSTPHRLLQSNIWKNNLYLPLLDLGHEVIEFDYDLNKTFQYLDIKKPYHKKFIEKNRPKLSQKLLSQIKKAHQQKPIDIFFSYFYDACILPETINEIKSLGVKTVNWYCNASYQLDLVSQISPHYDYCLVPEKFRLKDYKKLGAHPLYCQEAANPTIYKPYNIPQIFDVTFVGQAYGERPDYIKHLLEHNIKVKVWGIGWNCYTKTTQPFFHRLMKKTKKLFSSEGISIIRNKTSQLFQKETITKQTEQSRIFLPPEIVGQPLTDKEMIKLYSQSKINLGFSTCGNTHQTNERIVQIRLRDFEVPMSGGFYMVEYIEELQEFFDIGKEIVCYHTKEDLVDKIKYYLKHDIEREKIRQAGYSRSLRDHTWQKRFLTVFQKING